MRIGSVLREVVKEATILESYMKEPNADLQFITEHAEALSDYALLLRDLAATEEQNAKSRSRVARPVAH